MSTRPWRRSVRTQTTDVPSFGPAVRSVGRRRPRRGLSPEVCGSRWPSYTTRRHGTVIGAQPCIESAIELPPVPLRPATDPIRSQTSGPRSGTVDRRRYLQRQTDASTLADLSPSGASENACAVNRGVVPGRLGQPATRSSTISWPATQMAWFSVRTRPSGVVSGAHASVTWCQTWCCTSGGCPFRRFAISGATSWAHWVKSSGELVS